MLRYVDYDIVFQEIPDEMTLAINISGCPHRCHGCHSPHLWEEVGDELTEEVIDRLLQRYGAVGCVCFMGGDADLITLQILARYVHKKGKKAAWYSGFTEIPTTMIADFDYIKIGPYIEHLGGIRSSTTNQRLYKIEGGQMTHIAIASKNKTEL